MEREVLINRIKTRLDEVCSTGDIIVDVGVENPKPYDTLIEEVLDESSDEVLLAAPVFRLPVKSDNGLRITEDGKVGYVDVPDDFLRLVSMRMSEWERPVDALYVEGERKALMQSNKFIRGGIAKPVCVLGIRSGKRVIYYYSVDKEHVLTQFDYIARTHPEDIEEPHIIDAMCWIACSKVLGILGKFNEQKVCIENANRLMI